MTRTPVAVIGLVLLIVLAGCLGSAPQSTAAVSTGDASPGVSVSAAGAVDVEPDLAVVSLVVEATADSADEARSQVATDVASVRDVLAELGLGEDAVTTAYFSLQPEYDYSEKSRELVGYRAVHALRIEAGVDQAGAVIDAAVGAGAVRVNGVQFTLTDETRQSAREEALGLAMANAAADASALADAGDLTLGEIRSVSTGGSPVVIPFEGRLAEDTAGQTTIEPGMVSVSASVSVVYAIA